MRDRTTADDAADCSGYGARPCRAPGASSPSSSPPVSSPADSWPHAPVHRGSPTHHGHSQVSGVPVPLDPPWSAPTTTPTTGVGPPDVHHDVHSVCHHDVRRPPGGRTDAARRDSSGSVAPVDAAQVSATWRPGCPVGPAQLRLLTMSYWGFDGRPHTGTMVVNSTVTTAVLRVFG